MAKSRQAPAAGRRRPDDDDDTPRRRGRDDDDDDDDDGPVKPRKKRQSAAGPVRKVLYIIGGVVLAIALSVLIYWVYAPVGTDNSLFCYFPPETTSITGYDCAEVAANHKMADVHTAIIGVYKRFGDERWGNSGLTEKDVAKYLSGQATGNPDEEKDLPEQEKRGGITVIKFKQAVDRTKFIDSFTGRYTAREMDSRDGKKYHQLMRKQTVGVGAEAHEEQVEDISFFFPEGGGGRTLVYTTTRRECEEALRRTPGKVVVKDAMRELANEVDGHFFRASTGFIPVGAPGGGGGPASPFGLGIVSEESRNEYASGGGIVGSANWFASNGNEFLYGELKLFTDKRTASNSKYGLEESFLKAQKQIAQSEGGTASGLDDPFNPKPAAGGQQQGFGGPNAEDRKAIVAALNQYVWTSRVRQRGKAIIIEGRISHGTPEQGTFELFWKAIQNKVVPQAPQNNFNGFGMPGMGPPPPIGGPPR